MAFLNIFKSKPKGPKIIDKIFISQKAKDYALKDLRNKTNAPIFLAWSDITIQHYSKILEKSVLQVDKVIPSRIDKNEIFFLEHHFSKNTELEIMKLLNLKEAIFISSLDDPLFILFNSERIKELMIKMGHDENEPLEDKMISNSIMKAQKKIFEQGLPKDSSVELKAWYESIQ